MNKNYKLLVPFFAIALLLLMSFSAAAEIKDVMVEFNGIDLGPSTAVAYPNSKNIVKVTFTANATLADVEIEAEIPGYDVSETTFVGNIVEGITYTKILNLDLSSDLDNKHQNGKLYITVKTDDNELYHIGYSIEKQRESYEVSVLSVDYNTKVSGGDIVPVSVVLKNTGYSDLDDTYVIVSIPALGISTRGYLEDLFSEDDGDYKDSREKTVFLQIPSDAETGVYELVVEAYNDDAETVQKSVIAIDGVTTSEDDKTISQKDNSNSNSIIALTIVLAVVFVALLVVLIVLITKKDKTFEEVETSYY